MNSNHYDAGKFSPKEVPPSFKELQAVWLSGWTAADVHSVKNTLLNIALDETHPKQVQALSLVVKYLTATTQEQAQDHLQPLLRYGTESEILRSIPDPQERVRRCVESLEKDLRGEQ